MEVIEMVVCSWTLGRKTRVAALIAKCGVFATAEHLRKKGYTLEETLAIVSVSI